MTPAIGKPRNRNGMTELLILLFLVLIAFGSRRALLKQGSDGMKQTDSLRNMVRILYGSMWIPMLLQLLTWLPVWMGAVFYGKSITDGRTLAEHYGLLAGKYAVVCGFAILLNYIGLISVNARTVSSLRKGEQRYAKLSFQSGFHIGMVQSLFFAVFTAVMAQQLAGSFCQSGAEVVTRMLRYGSVMIIWAVLGLYFAGFLMLTGKKYHLLGVLGAANILFIILVSILLNTSEAGIMSIIYASLVSGGVFCLLSGFLCYRILHTEIEWIPVIAVPVGGACIFGLVCLLLGKVLTPHLGNTVTAIVCLVIGLVVYWVVLLLFRSIREQELKCIPGARLIRAMGQMLRVF